MKSSLRNAIIPGYSGQEKETKAAEKREERQEEKRPASELGALAAAAEKTKGSAGPVKTYTIIGGGQKSGERQHGSRHPLADKKTDDDATLVWDAMARRWVPRGKLSAWKGK
jgi:hypothetical protein